jgi:arylsulfatase A
MRNLHALLLTGILLANSLSAAEASPNFIVINIDDLGYADIGPFGSTKNRTPNLDRMAKEGMRLTSFYAAPVCSPSRAMLMTGCYPKRVLPTPHVLFPVSEVGLHPEEVTIAEILKSVGYTTGCVGKWHLGDQAAFLPSAQGFDFHHGLPYSNDMGTAAEGSKSDLGAAPPKSEPTPKPGKMNPSETSLRSSAQPPLPMLRNGKAIARIKINDQQSLVADYTREAIDFIRRSKDQSFFLYLPHSSVHFPLYPGEKWAGRSPHGLYSDWVEETDWSVGQIFETLRELGLDRRTLVIFTSDNGGTTRGNNAPLRGNKSSTWEGGVRVPTIAWWPGKIPADSSTSAITGMFDVLPTLTRLANGKLPERRINGVDCSRFNPL